MPVRQLEPSDWELHRELRLAALQTNPEAFASTHEREIEFDEATWRGRLSHGPDGRPAAVFNDTDDHGTPLGTAAIVYTDNHVAPMIVGMWVRPEARGTGSGGRLVQACVDWAHARDEPQVVLWVVDDNHAAIGLYESCGFVATGVVDTLPSNPCSGELEMMHTRR